MSLSRKRLPHPESGFTLIELMIGMVLGLILIGGVLSIFIQTQQSSRADNNVARMQDQARFALDELASDIRMAGYLSDPLTPAAVTLDAGLALGTDCGPPGTPQWIYRLMDPANGNFLTITGVNNASGATANNAYGCIATNELRANTDIIATKRVAGRSLTPAQLQAGTVYLRTNGSIGLLYGQPGGAAFGAPFTDWEYRPRVYYIRRFSDNANDNIPSLCRKVLAFGGAPTMQTECIAQGIEDLQIEYGIDTDADGAPNRYAVNPPIADLQNVISARITLLARTLQRDPRYVDAKTYTLSDAPAYSPGDNFHRRIYSVTVPIHNLRNLERMRT